METKKETPEERTISIIKANARKADEADQMALKIKILRLEKERNLSIGFILGMLIGSILTSMFLG
jgi:hypothetical protein